MFLPNSRSRAAFTLIEILVVVAVISLLAAILFPVFARSRAKARQASCMNNLKQLGLAMSQYELDFDGFTVPHRYYETYSEPFVIRTWYARYYFTAGSYDFSQGLLQPYLQNIQVLDCLETSEIPKGALPLPLAYGINFRAIQSVTINGMNNTMGVNSARFQSPAETIELAESARYNSISDTVIRLELVMPPSQSLQDNRYSSIHGRHSGLANVLFRDGHVKAMPVSYPSTTSHGVEGKPFNIGDLMHPGYGDDGCRADNAPTGARNSAGECDLDYYFSFIKPGG